MTLLILALIGMGIIFIASALDDTPIVQTFQKILGGQPIDWTGAAGALTGPTSIQGVAGTGKPGTVNASPAPAGGWQVGVAGTGKPGTINASPAPSSWTFLNPPSVPTNTQGTGGIAWTKFPVTQAHGVNGETGIDLGTPQGTPLGALAAGQVVSASYGPWGGSVFVKVQNGAGWLYYNYLHLDQIAVNVGQQLAQGQFIGYSGGQTSGGNHPVQNSPGHIYSTGAHTEFGIYTTPYISPGGALDPSQFYQFG